MILARGGNSVQIQLPSSEVQVFNGEAMASIGQLSNSSMVRLLWVKQVDQDEWVEDLQLEAVP